MKTKNMKKNAHNSSIHDLLEYKNGFLYWKERHNNKIPESLIAGHQESRGYIHISLNGKKYLAHRLVWELHNGEIPKGLVVDHINQDKTDNRIENLRIVSYSLNALNTKKTKGVRKHSSVNRWQAYITISGCYKHLGNFSREEDAIKARREAEFEFLVKK